MVNTGKPHHSFVYTLYKTLFTYAALNTKKSDGHRAWLSDDDDNNNNNNKMIKMEF
jgi:hypothetical protein